jgi:hypothetical protein
VLHSSNKIALRLAQERMRTTLFQSSVQRSLHCPRSYRYRCLDGWQEKETHAAMDPQLLCFSLLTGISAVAFVVFVRKNHPERLLHRTIKIADARFSCVSKCGMNTSFTLDCSRNPNARKKASSGAGRA